MIKYKLLQLIGEIRDINEEAAEWLYEHQFDDTIKNSYELNAAFLWNNTCKGVNYWYEISKELNKLRLKAKME